MSDDTTWFWTIVDARGLANVSSDEVMALKELISKAERAEAAEARVTALEAEKAGLVKALRRIADHPEKFDDGTRSYAVGFAFWNVQKIARASLSRSTEKNDGTV